MSDPGIYESTTAPRLDIQQPVLVFLKVSKYMEALPRGIFDDIAQYYDADVHSAGRIRQEVDTALGPPADSRDSGYRSQIVGDELISRMEASVAAGRSAILDFFLRTPERREPFVETAHRAGAEVVALNIFVDSELRASRQKGMDRRQRVISAKMVKKPCIKAGEEEGIDHVLRVDDHLRAYTVYKRITTRLDRRLSCKTPAPHL